MSKQLEKKDPRRSQRATKLDPHLSESEKRGGKIWETRRLEKAGHNPAEGEGGTSNKRNATERKLQQGEGAPTYLGEKAGLQLEPKRSSGERKKPGGRVPL